MITLSQCAPPVHSAPAPDWAAHHAEIARQLDAIAARRVERQAEHETMVHSWAVEDSVEVSPVAEAEWSGFQLGLEGFAVAGPAHYSPEELAAFMRGHRAGFKQYEEDEFDAWVTEQERQDAAFGDPDDRHHPAEFIEFAGVDGRPA